jgi:hypothetical protein
MRGTVAACIFCYFHLSNFFFPYFPVCGTHFLSLSQLVSHSLALQDRVRIDEIYAFEILDTHVVAIRDKATSNSSPNTSPSSHKVISIGVFNAFHPSRIRAVRVAYPISPTNLRQQ